MKLTRALIFTLIAHTTAVLMAADARPSAEQLLSQTRANYAVLESYADSGTVFTEYKDVQGPLIAERHSFTTRYRAPRQFLLDFNEDKQAGGDRFVIWSDGGDFNTWWLTTDVHERYPKGQGSYAFAQAALPTKGSSAQTPPLLFANAGLHGPLSDLARPKLVGMEELAGKPCHKLIGEVGLAYGTGAVTNTRPTTVWIDAETLLVRKIVEDAVTGSPTGSVDRITTSFEPLANPELDDAQFRFTPPK